MNRESLNDYKKYLEQGIRDAVRKHGLLAPYLLLVAGLFWSKASVMPYSLLVAED